MLLTLLITTAFASPPPSLTSNDPGPDDPTVHIGGGRDLQTCEWPSVVGLQYPARADVRCTGALIHPSIVLTAAHCVAPEIAGESPSAVIFGEDAEAPARSVDIADCAIHPDYDVADFADLDGVDIAVCELAQSVTDVPVIAPLVGCENELVEEGTPVTLVGFGVDQLVLNDAFEFVESSGSGIKREAVAALDGVLPTSGALPELNILVVGEGQGVGSGDSGGPGLLQLDDGSWRIFGVAHALNPLLVVPGENLADDGGMYKALSHALPWIEQATGADVTPCHDADGTWNPGPDCDAFPLAPARGGGQWDEGCVTAEVSGLGASCGEPYDPESGGSSDTGGSGTDSASDESVGDESPGDESPGGTGDDGLPGGTGATTGDPEPPPGADDDGAGCACTTSDPARPLGNTASWAALLLLLAARRRGWPAPR